MDAEPIIPIQPINTSQISSVGQDIVFTADERICRVLADSLGLDQLIALSVTLRLSRVGDQFSLKGRLVADVIQSCVISGAPVAEHIDEVLNIRFVPLNADEKSAPIEMEIDLSEDEGDIVDLEEERIDVATAILDTLSLALNPYPKAPNSELSEARKLLLSEEEAINQASPFALLGNKSRSPNDKG